MPYVDFERGMREPDPEKRLEALRVEYDGLKDAVKLAPVLFAKASASRTFAALLSSHMPFLVESLKDPDARVRNLGCLTLGLSVKLARAQGWSEVAEAGLLAENDLRTLLNDSDTQVRKSAQQSLSQVASTDAKEVVGEPDDHVTASSHRVAQDATSPPDSTFEMPVEDVFVIEGRGTVATGCITKGFVRNGEELTIRHPNGLEVRTVCAGLETFERKLTAAQAGDHVGLLLREVARNEIHPGALLYSVTEKDPLSEEEAQGEPQGEFQKACFIATACYGSHDCAEVLELRAFRDEVLNVGYLGRALVALYYRVSPPVATWLRRRPRLAAVLREWLLDRIVCLVRRQDRAMPNKPDAGDG